MDLVPGDAEDIGQEALDQPVAADDGLGLATAPLREGERLVIGTFDVAVALEPADHLVDRRRGELHRPRDVRAVDLQSGLLEPEHRLQVLLLSDGGFSHEVDATWSGFRASATTGAVPPAGRPTPRSPSGSTGPPRRGAAGGACSAFRGRPSRR